MMTRVTQLWDLIEACGFCKDISNNSDDDEDDNESNEEKNVNNNEDKGISALELDHT